MAGTTIEPAETDDVDELTEMWLSLAREQREHGSHILSGENRTVIREAMARHVVGDALQVARDGGVVGFVMFTVESGSYEQEYIRGVVENLYVAPDRRGEGVGARLLAAAETVLENRGVEAVSLEVMADNDRARSFYRRQGYDPHRVELEKPTESDTHSRGDT